MWFRKVLNFQTIINRDHNHESNLLVVMRRDNSMPEVLDLESYEKSSVIIDTTVGCDRLGVAVVCSEWTRSPRCACLKWWPQALSLHLLFFDLLRQRWKKEFSEWERKGFVTRLDLDLLWKEKKNTQIKQIFMTFPHLNS